MCTRDEYNKAVQDMQEFCIAVNLGWRFQTDYSDKPTPSIVFARFQVHYGGWHTIGSVDKPFTEEAMYSWHGELDQKIRARVARDIVS